MKTRLLFAFLLSFSYALIIPALFPSLRLTFFAPFICLLFYRTSYAITLWSAFLVGLLVDLLSSHTEFGICALNYCLTAALLYHRNQMLFEDNLTTIPTFSALFGLISSCIQFPLLYVFEAKKLHLSLDWIGTDLVAMPLLDGFYALFGVLIPLSFLKLFQTHRRSRRRF